uniref:programmed cell death 6-interacting protein-like isoform X2 n=1 Tax=Styela clava TaxID=7725 RepID=UPI00193A8E98|nr:programmed cell death 6-interacting protein-like isoform X2 [Styela clava]
MAYTLEAGRFVTVPLKRSSDVDLIKPIEAFARNTFDKVDDDLKKQIKEFNSLRKSAVGKTQDRSVSSLNTLLQYYDQFSALNRKVPFRESGGVNVLFAWKDALDKGSLFSGSAKLALPSGEYERLCVIFNIAALKGQIASDSNLSTDDGLKSAALHFAESAGMFQYIKEHVMSAVNQNPTQDISVEVLGAFKSIMVAQAQECFYEKASSDKMKPDILAKVANQAATLYSEASKAVTETNNILPKDILSALSLRHDKFLCFAQFHQAGVAHGNKKYGEEIARLKIVEPMLKALGKGSELLPGFSAKDFQAKVTSQLQGTEKENNFIYHDTIPRESALEPIGKAVIAKPKLFKGNEVLSAKFTDAFTGMVPLTVHNAIQSYENRRKEIVEREVARLREQTTLINGVMSSLNLPAALEDASGGDQLPPSILEKSQAVLGKGGIQAIDDLMRELPESLQRNEQILTEVSRMLNEEQTTDDELRAKFGAKWTRTKSSELTVPLRQEIQKYTTIIDNAQKADKIVREKFNTQREGIEMLCMPADQLKTAIPSASKIAALKNNPVVTELRQLCEQAETLKAEREVIENEIGGAKSDMTDKFTEALASEGVLNEESISIEELDRVYQPLIQQVTESVHRQESVLANIQRASEQFTTLKSQGAGGNNRDEVLKKIAAAHDGYMELIANLQEGKKFYGDLTQLLIKLQNKCSDLVFARKTEKEEIMKWM